MKIQFLVLLFCTLSMQAFAQPEKGTVMIGTSTNMIGSLSSAFQSVPNSEGNFTNSAIQFGTLKTEFDNGRTTVEFKSTVIAFNLHANVGKFVTNTVMIGASIGATYFSVKTEDNDPNSVTSFSILPNARFYLKEDGTSLPYIEARAGIITGKSNSENAERETLPIFAAKVGNSFFIRPNVALDVFGEYNYARNKDGDTTSSAGFFGAGIGLSIFLNGNNSDD